MTPRHASYKLVADLMRREVEELFEDAASIEARLRPLAGRLLAGRKRQAASADALDLATPATDATAACVNLGEHLATLRELLLDMEATMVMRLDGPNVDPRTWSRAHVD